jgi:hypothetical protein
MTTTTLTNRRRTMGDASAAGLGRLVTAAFVIAVSQLGVRPQDSDIIVTLVSQGGAVVLFCFQMATTVATPTLAAGGEMLTEGRRLMRFSLVAAALFAILHRPLLEFLGISPTLSVTASWVVLLCAAPVGVLSGIQIARSHIADRSRFRFLVPFSSPLGALIVFLVTRSVFWTTFAWALAWGVDYVVLRHLNQQGERSYPSPQYRGESRMTQRLGPAVIVTQICSIATSGIIAACMNRMGDGLTSAYYGADRIVMGLLGLGMALVLPRVWTGRALSGPLPGARRWALVISVSVLSATVLGRLIPESGSRVSTMAVIGLVLMCGWPVFASQQVLQARLLTAGRPWAGAGLALASLAVVGCVGIGALLAGSPGMVPVGVVWSAAVATLVGLRMSRTRPA